MMLYDLEITNFSSMKFGVVTFPGSNCDTDIQDALHLLDQKVEMLWHKDTDLKDCDAIFIPGGFSYGDYLRSGAIAQFSPIMSSIKAFAQQGGIVMGICNGFQILCESGLLPGTLLHNSNQKFICTNAFIKAEQQNTLLTTESKDVVLKIPIAHAEGRYFIDQKGLEDLKKNDQILFKYCDAKGQINTQNNPNGSIENIAGVCNITKNVFGMMPHPERACDALLKNTDGARILKNLISSVQEIKA